MITTAMSQPSFQRDAITTGEPPWEMARAAPPLAVRAERVCKIFGTGPLAFRALDDVSLEVPEGQFVMLSGPSGSGKTTLLSILGAVMTATSGTVELFGHDLTKLAEKELPTVRSALIGFVFQGHNLLAALDALDNVSLVARLRGMPRRLARAEAADLLDRVGLGSKLHHKPSELSGGQRQRVAVARALAGAPPLLLADEPTASLDAVAGLDVTRMMLSLCRDKGTTAIIVTHDHRIFPLADRVVHIEDGKIDRSSRAPSLEPTIGGHVESGAAAPAPYARDRGGIEP